LDPKPFFFDPSVDMYKIPDGAAEIAGLPLLPQNLLDALRATEGDAELKDLLGAGFLESFLKLKRAEWEDFMRHLSDWELRRTLDC